MIRLIITDLFLEFLHGLHSLIVKFFVIFVKGIPLEFSIYLPDIGHVSLQSHPPIRIYDAIILVILDDI
jgi:hypothetical protein